MLSPGRISLLVVLSCALSLVNVAYVAFGVPISGRANELAGFSLAVFVILWMVRDARARGCLPCFDFGFLVCVFFPLSLVWYALWSRGAKGVLLLAAVFGLWILPWSSAVVARIILHGAG
ncbi:MAG TPA: hypothetical protein VGY53_12120 [Isosphaeraceae bacterium]|nr:hypothetical protein [Isosphaeraceae bacterium]